MHTLEGEGSALPYSQIFIQYSKGVCPTETLGVVVVEMMLLNLEHSLTRENGARDGVTHIRVWWLTSMNVSFGAMFEFES